MHIEEEDEIITLKQKKELLAIEGIEKLVFKYTPPKEADGSYTITLADDLEREDIIKTLYLNRLPQSKNIMIDHGERSEGCMLLRKENDLWISLPEKGAMAFVGAFSLTKIPFWELLPDENRTPLLTLVDAYIAMAGNSERNNGHDLYQEIPLKNVIEYLSSSERDHRKQIPRDEKIITTDKNGKVFLTELDVITRTNIKVDSSNGDLQQDSDKKNLYVKEARSIGLATRLFENSDEIKRDPRGNDILITTGAFGYKLVWRFSTSLDENNKYLITLEKAQKAQNDRYLGYTRADNIAISQIKARISRVISDLKDALEGNPFILVKESDFFLQIGYYAFFYYDKDDEDLCFPFWLEDLYNYDRQLTVLGINSDKSSMVFSIRTDRTKIFYHLHIKGREDTFRLKNVEKQTNQPVKLYEGNIYTENQDLIIKGHNQPLEDCIDALPKIKNIRYIIWKPDLTRPTTIDLSYSYKSVHTDPQQKTTVNLLKFDDSLAGYSKFFIQPELSEENSNWENLIIHDDDSEVKKEQEITIENKHYKLILPSFNDNKEKELYSIIFELDSDPSVQILLHEIIISAEKQLIKSGMMKKVSTILRDSNSIQLYRRGYRYDFRRKILWKILGANSKKAVLSEVSRAILRAGSTQQNIIIDITTTLGFEITLTINGDECSFSSLGSNKTIQGQDIDLYLSDLKYAQELVIKRSDSYTATPIRGNIEIDLSKASKTDIERINERADQYTSKYCIQRRNDDLMIYNADQYQTDILLSAFKRDERIEDKLEKIKIRYRSIKREKTASLFILLERYRLLSNNNSDKMRVKDVLKNIDNIKLAQRNDGKYIVYDHEEKKLLIAVFNGQSRASETILCDKVIKAKKEDSFIVFKTEDGLSWDFSIDKYDQNGKHPLYINQISKEYIQYRTDLTSQELYADLQEARESLTTYWSEITIPDKIQYSATAKSLCSCYDLTKTFTGDLEIIGFNDKVLFIESNKVTFYDYKNRSWKEKIFSGSQTLHTSSVAVMEDKIILFGGKINFRAYSSAIYIYNNNTESWETVTNYTPEARFGASVAIIGTQAIFFGGRKNGNDYSSAIDIYNSNDNTWEKVEQQSYTPEARVGASVAVIGTKAVFFGGVKYHNASSSSIDIYDSKNNTRPLY